MCILCVIVLFFSLFVFLFCLFAIYLLLPYWVNKDEYITAEKTALERSKSKTNIC